MSYQFSQDPEENLPDWLKELRKRQREAQAGEDPQRDSEESPATSDEETGGTRPEAASAKEQEAETVAESSSPTESEPDWLLEIRRRYQRDEDGPPARKKPSIPLEDQPDALSSPATGDDEDLDDALGDTQPMEAKIVEPEAREPEPASATESDEEQVGEDEALDWTSGENAEESAPDGPVDLPPEGEAQDVEPEGFEEPAEAEDEVPDWLAGDSESIGENASDGEMQAEEPDEAVGAEIEANQEPHEFSEEDWLGFEAAEEGEEEATAEGDSDLPDWLQQEDMDVAFGHTPAFAGGDESDLAPAELPSWLQALRPPTASEDVEASSSRDLLPDQEENVGPLAGLRGVLPAEPEVVRIGKPRMPTGRLEITEGQARHAAMLERLIAEEGRPKEDFGKQIALPSRILNIVIAGAMLLATLIPIISGSQNATVPQAEAYPDAAPLFNTIEALPEEAPVLVAFDVEPGLYGEVKTPAAEVLAHLLERQARLVFISTQATGPALAERLLTQELGDDPNMAIGNYVNLGYLSGGMAALRAFAEDPRNATEIPSLPDNPWDEALLQSIGSLNDFGLVLVISSETEDARAWIEQTADELTAGLYMVTSAQAAPLMQPYLDSHPLTLRGLVAGLAGAVHYEGLQGAAGAGRAAWDAYSYALGAAVLAILLGGLYNRLIHLRPAPEDEDPDA